MINEGARLLEEGIALRASDIDVVYTSGYGFPRYRGGPMFYADTVGLKVIYERILEFQRQLDPQYWSPAPLLEKLALSGSSFAQWDATSQLRRQNYLTGAFVHYGAGGDRPLFEGSEAHVSSARDGRPTATAISAAFEHPCTRSGTQGRGVIRPRQESRKGRRSSNALKPFAATRGLDSLPAKLSW